MEGACRHRNDTWLAGPDRSTPDPASRLEPIQLGHLDIHKHHVVMLTFERVEDLQPVICHIWAVAKLCEDAHGEPPSIPFWLGEAPGRSDELSASVSRLRTEVEASLERGIPAATEALIAAMPLTNSVSPTGRIASGPSARCMARHCTKTVAVLLWPWVVSASSSGSR